MARGKRKMISAHAVLSKKLAGVSDQAERLYWRLQLASDNYGCMDGDPWDVLHTAMPGVDKWSEAKTDSALRALADALLIEVWTEGGSDYLFVVGHDDHQSADFLRKRGRRTYPVPPSQRGENVVPMRPAALTADNDALRSPSLPPQHQHQLQPLTGGLSPTGDMSDKQSDVDGIRAVFEHWVQLAWNGHGQAPKLSNKRRAKIRSRLAEGWSVDELQRSLGGFAKAPFYNGDQDGKRKLELVWRLQNSEEVERGLQLADETSKSSGASDWAETQAKMAEATRLAEQRQREHGGIGQ